VTSTKSVSAIENGYFCKGGTSS